ncbi:3556_t:CDS:2 [Racocetra fulgida]|uniref:3556_t:CDS:1 n=1 Tax=Racocetra fulgida TaxID=60492 RepID=A0A9N9HD67_9GLOM|nr:3556_t:CDS:2 [Racocetra fulgida]
MELTNPSVDSISTVETVEEKEECQPYTILENNDESKLKLSFHIHLDSITDDSYSHRKSKSYTSREIATGTGSTVEGVVKQHNLERKPSPQQDLQFDFNRFLQQMANPSATNIARYVKK